MTGETVFIRRLVARAIILNVVSLEKHMHLKTVFAPALIMAVLALAPVPVLAVDSTPTPVISPEHATGRRSIESKDWLAAIRSLTAAAQREPRNADVHNLLGFAYRNAGQLEPALKHYQRALQLDPSHLGAHEYIGEAYLMTDNLVKAEEHLAVLKKICPRVCEEYDDLNKKIAAFQARSK